MQVDEQREALARNEFRPNTGDVFGIVTRERCKQFYQHIGSFVCEDDRAADFGGMDGYVAKWWLDTTRCPMTVIDCLPELLSLASNQGLPVLNADISSLPLDDGAIQWGFCSHTLEHTESIEATLKELFRVVSHAMMIVVPLEDDELVKKNLSHMHHNPDPCWWEARIKEAGFIVKWRQDHHNEYDAIYLCFKPDFFDEWNAEIQKRSHHGMSEEEHDIHNRALRERITRLAKKFGASLANTSWIDFGGSDGEGVNCLRTNAGVSAVNVDFVEELGVDIVANLISVPVEDQSYDWVFSSHTLEHVKDIEAVIKEMYRVCRKGAYVIVPLQSARDAAAYISHISHSDDPQWWIDKFLAVGFSLKETGVYPYFNNLPELDIWLVKQ